MINKIKMFLFTTFVVMLSVVVGNVYVQAESVSFNEKSYGESDGSTSDAEEIIIDERIRAYVYGSPAWVTLAFTYTYNDVSERGNINMHMKNNGDYY